MSERRGWSEPELLAFVRGALPPSRVDIGGRLQAVENRARDAGLTIYRVDEDGLRSEVRCNVHVGSDVVALASGVTRAVAHGLGQIPCGVSVTADRAAHVWEAAPRDEAFFYLQSDADCAVRWVAF